MSQHRNSIQDPAAPPPAATTTHADGPAVEPVSSPALTTRPASDPATRRPTRRPMPAIVADRPSSSDSGPRGRIGWIVVGSLATGLLAALLLVLTPFIPATESAVTGAVLCGFALGRTMLAVFSVRFTDQPQRWAAAPALFMGLGGLLLVAFGSSVAWGAQLGVASRAAGVGDLDDRLRPSTASEPERTLAALPGVRDSGYCLGGRRL